VFTICRRSELTVVFSIKKAYSLSRSTENRTCLLWTNSYYGYIGWGANLHQGGSGYKSRYGM